MSDNEEMPIDDEVATLSDDSMRSSDEEPEWSDEEAGGQPPDPRTVQIRALHAVREAHLADCERFFAEIEDDEKFQALTTSDLRIRRTRLQKYFEKFEASNIDYCRVSPLASNGLFIAMEARFMRVMSKIEDKLQCREPDGEAQERFTQAMSFANSTMLPGGRPAFHVEMARPPQIGKFDGTPRDWPAFRDLFIAEVHDREFNAVNKLQYLKEACVGQAAETLGPWAPTASNYQVAWDVLVKAYDDTYHVIHGVLGKMFSTPAAENESFSVLRTAADSINNTIRQLDTMITKESALEQMFIHFWRAQLPGSTLDSWEQYRNRKLRGGVPSLEAFRDFLDVRAKGRQEYAGQPSKVVKEASPPERKSKSDSKSSRFKPYDKKSQSNVGSSNPFRKEESSSGPRPGFGPPVQCVMPSCNELHYLGQCTAFRSLPLVGRLDVIKQSRLCRCCLLPGHMATACERSGCSKCPEEKAKHHYRLCAKTAINPKVPAIKSSAEQN